ncbi:MAG TPA: hypothetical protein EYN66_13675, partial [Myxococcales bacterium]|nr:hypothetical protein [Myxococcales bacterium]
MAGVSTGPRQFQLMTPFNTLKDGGLSGNAGSGWQFSSLPAGSGGMCWITRKLDLRAFNGSDKANGLDLLAITVQEASPFFQVVDDQEETGGLFTLDVLTTVEMDDLAIAYWCQPGLHHFMTPGFLYSPSVGASAERIDEMSPSQV